MGNSLLPGVAPTALLRMLREEKARRERENWIEGYRPYERQAEFHALGGGKRERLFMATNQGGKCITIRSIVDTPQGRRPMADILATARPFEVLAWDGDAPVRAWASAPFRKPGVHHCFRLTMADGQWVEAADHHLIWCDDGWQRISALLPQFGLGHLASSLGFSPEGRSVDGLRWCGTPSGCPGDCFGGCRRCGEPLPLATGSGQGCPPSRGDALPHSFVWCGEGDPQTTDTNIGRLSYALHSNSDDLRRCEVLSAGFSVRDVCIGARWSSGSRPFLPQLTHGSFSGFQSGLESVHACRSGRREGSCAVPAKYGNKIISCDYIGRHEVYDFEVAGWHNYVAGGLIHHNTLAGACEAAIHMTGLYPDWWQGHRFEQGNSGWAGAPTNELVRDIVQLKLLGPMDDIGTGAIPKHLIEDFKLATGVRDLVDTVVVRHVTGSKSRLKFKTYDQGRLRWQAATLDWVWFDEEPPADVYDEGKTRTNATKGIVWTTFTPLLGMSEVVQRFMRNDNPDLGYVRMTLYEVGHVGEAERERIINSYPEHERDARVLGLPKLGEGQVFPIPRAMITCEPFAIPRHWARIAGIDIGWDHPTAAVELAWDREADCVYVTKTYKQAKQTIAIHAGALSPWGKKLPWAWPHDAASHERGSGEQVAQLYRDYGLNMLGEHAQFPDKRGNSTEAGVMEILDRMQTGRFRVFSNLGGWFDEFDIYHRKDGKIVKQNDDLMSATRHAMMMLRFARTAPAPYDPYARASRGKKTRGSAMAA